VTRKSRVVTFRMDQATWDWMRELVPYTRYGNPSSFIREGIELLLKRARTSSRRGGPQVGREGGERSCAGASLGGRRCPWGLAVRPLAPVRSTERPAGEVIPATRQECAGGYPAGEGPDERAARGCGRITIPFTPTQQRRRQWGPDSLREHNKGHLIDDERLRSESHEPTRRTRRHTRRQPTFTR
jgi:Arc/MetJ-type ribon-helix-helix transcriptional regulator